MKRTLVVLALAVLSSAGCRAVAPFERPGCGDACSDPCCEPCHVTRAQHAPRPMLDGGHGVGRGGNYCEQHPCHCEDCALFRRHCGHNCGPGYHPGPYDCSPCDSPHWGCSGHRHPHGYVTGQGCICQAHGVEQCPQCPPHGVGGYCLNCGGPPSPGGECCPCCGPSGDHVYTFNPGPPTGQTAYPYYTLRGPRDFLLGNPPSIGPY
jgi:hypothetical protein